MGKKCKYCSTMSTGSHTAYLCSYDDDFCYCYGKADECEIGVGEYAGVLEELQPIYTQYKNSPTVVIPTDLVERIIEELKESDS